jgi:hypothetical protein
MGHDMMLDNGHTWLVDLLINCMDFPIEQEEVLPVINKLRVASSAHRKSLEPAVN